MGKSQSRATTNCVKGNFLVAINLNILLRGHRTELAAPLSHHEIMVSESVFMAWRHIDRYICTVIAFDWSTNKKVDFVSGPYLSRTEFHRRLKLVTTTCGLSHDWAAEINSKMNGILQKFGPHTLTQVTLHTQSIMLNLLISNACNFIR